MRKHFSDLEIRGMNAKGLGGKEMSAYAWLFSKKAIGRTIIVYRENFRKWLKKDRFGDGSISSRHASRVIQNLGEKGFAEVKSLGSGAFEVTLFSLDFVFGQECRDQTKLSSDSKSQNQDPAKTSPHNPASNRVKQQQLVEIKQLWSQELILRQEQEMIGIVVLIIVGSINSLLFTLPIILFKFRDHAVPGFA